MVTLPGRLVGSIAFFFFGLGVLAVGAGLTLSTPKAAASPMTYTAPDYGWLQQAKEIVKQECHPLVVEWVFTQTPDKLVLSGKCLIPRAKG